MAQIKTAELEGAALDWAVAKCEKFEVRVTPHVKFPYIQILYPPENHRAAVWGCYNATEWAQGGPIVEREGIAIDCLRCDGKVEEWFAAMPSQEITTNPTEWFGKTILIAAMRCYVASKLGDEVLVPDELVTK